MEVEQVLTLFTLAAVRAPVRRGRRPPSQAGVQVS
jgi:hypothetical protein